MVSDWLLKFASEKVLVEEKERENESPPSTFSQLTTFSSPDNVFVLLIFGISSTFSLSAIFDIGKYLSNHLMKSEGS